MGIWAYSFWMTHLLTAGDPTVSVADAQRAAKILAANPPIQERAHLPEVKLLERVGPTSIYLRTDRMVVDRLKGEGLYLDDHAPADSIQLAIGGRCRIGAHRQWHDLTLLKIDDKQAIFHLSSHLRNGKEVEEVIAVAPYRLARWEADPQDKTRVTYTEFDVKGNRRLEKHYRQDRLDGSYLTWYADGKKQAEHHYVLEGREGRWTEWHANGQKSHEVHYRNNVPIGQELWWDEQGRVSAIGEHPDAPPVLVPAQK